MRAFPVLRGIDQGEYDKVAHKEQLSNGQYGFPPDAVVTALYMKRAAKGSIPPYILRNLPKTARDAYEKVVEDAKKGNKKGR